MINVIVGRRDAPSRQRYIKSSTFMMHYS